MSEYSPRKFLIQVSVFAIFMVIILYGIFALTEDSRANTPPEQTKGHVDPKYFHAGATTFRITGTWGHEIDCVALVGPDERAGVALSCNW